MSPHADDARAMTLAGRPAPSALPAPLARLPARRGQRPFVTFYGETTGERTELGHATLHNWVSKTANLLADDADLAPAARLSVRLPTHWTTAVVLLAAWRAGLVVDLRAAGVTAEGRAVAEDGAADALDAPGTVVVGRGFGGRAVGDIGGALDFGVDVLACGDEFDDPDDAAPDAAALVVAEGTLTHAALGRLAESLVEGLALTAGVRVLSTCPLDGVEGIGLLLAALLADASLVLVADAPDDAAVAARARDERCDVMVHPEGPSGAGGRALRVVWEGGAPAALRLSPAGSRPG